jgi:hypothetical protein
MQQEARDTRTEDDSTHRTEAGESSGQQVPVVRLLANPRRVRRA